MVFSSNELDLLILQHGKDGVSADSKYIWVKYSQNPDGSELTDDPAGAVYIGIAYNKDSVTESEDPADYSWSKIQGEHGTDAYTVILSNENVSFAVDYGTHTATNSQAYSSTVVVFQGTEERSDFTIGEVVSANGITASKTKNTVTLSVEDNAEITADHGSFRIPISIDGLVFFKDMTWTLAQQGKDGTSAINVIVGNEAQNIPCTDEGVVAEGFLINIPFQGYVGTEKVGATAVVGLLPNGVTLGTNTPATNEEDGLIILNVAKGADFGGEDVLTGDVTITFSVGEQQVVKHFTWSKTKDGAEGSMTIYELEASSYVISKNLDGTLTPESVTFNAYSRMSNSTERADYGGRFIIEESDNGASYKTKYLSSKNENTVTYTPSSSDIHSIRCTLCQADQVSITLDRQTIPLLKDSDNLKPIIDEITTTMQGIETKVDNVEQSITDKVWQTDITTAINNYDGSTANTIRDQVSQQQITINGITQTVKDVQTEIDKKADGSTVSSLSEKVSEMEQTVDGFKTEVSETYVSKSDFEEALGDLEGQTGIDWKVNYSDLETAKNNWIYVYSKDDLADGWILWNAAKVVISNMSINTGVAPQTGIPIYLVLRVDSNLISGSQWILTDQNDNILVDQDGNVLVRNSYVGSLVWFEQGSGWQSYNLLQKQKLSWEWENSTDAIIATFSRTNSGIIDSSKLYVPPLMYNELGITLEQRSYIEQTKDSITQVVEETYATKEQVDQVRSESIQTATEIKDTVQVIGGELTEVSQKADRIESLVGTKQNVVPTAIRYIRDWLGGNSVNTGNHFVECKVMSGDDNVAEGLTAKAFNENHTVITVSNIERYTDGNIASSSYVTVSGTAWVYIQIDLGEVRRDIDTINVWHYYSDSRTYNHRLEVSSDGNSWVELYNSETQGGYVEKSSGAVYNLNDSNISDKFSKITQTIDSITSRVQQNEDNYSELTQDLSGFKTEVSQVYATKDNVSSLENALASSGMSWRVNYSSSTTQKNNWIAAYPRDPDEGGWIMWNGAKIVVPELSIDTSVVSGTGFPIYIVYRIEKAHTSALEWILVDQSGNVLLDQNGNVLISRPNQIYLVWFKEGTGWTSYNIAQKASYSWNWQNSLDVVLATFSRTSSTSIDSFKPYAPPLMYNELGITLEQRSYIEQTADHITQVVEGTYATKDSVNDMKSEFTQTANEISLSVTNAQNSAGDAQSTADNAISRIETTEEAILTINNTISSLVSDGNGNTLMTQGPNGWTFDITQITDNMNSLSSQINSMGKEIDSTYSLADIAKDLADSIAKKTAYIEIKTVNSQPAIILGQSSNNFKLQITNTSIDFMDGSTRVAYVSNQQLYIERAIVKSDLQMGDGSNGAFVWRVRSNGNLGLRWES